LILWLALVVLALAAGIGGLAVWIFRDAAKVEDMRWTSPLPRLGALTAGLPLSLFGPLQGRGEGTPILVCARTQIRRRRVG
jgi:hypothetical protein